MGGRNRWRPTGPERQRAEWEAAKRRILGLAESDHTQTTPVDSTATRAHRDADVTAPSRSRRRLPYEGYLLAVASTLVRLHRPAWSWRKWRWVCRGGAELPCRNRHRVPINRGHWPSQEDQ